MIKKASAAAYTWVTRYKNNSNFIDFTGLIACYLCPASSLRAVASRSSR